LSLDGLAFSVKAGVSSQIADRAAPVFHTNAIIFMNIKPFSLIILHDAASPNHRHELLRARLVLSASAAR
jgi:hypothetical protein